MTRRVLNLLDAMVRDLAKKSGLEVRDIRFTRREVRERLGVGGTQAWIHLRRLIEHEFVIVHPSRRGRGVVFELALESERTTPQIRGRRRMFGGAFGGCSAPPKKSSRPRKRLSKCIIRSRPECTLEESDLLGVVRMEPRHGSREEVAGEVGARRSERPERHARLDAEVLEGASREGAVTADP